MAAGDVVNGITAGGATTFQPSAGVECVITMTGTTFGTDKRGALYNGATEVVMIEARPAASIGFSSAYGKIFINNTNYLIVNTTPSGYTGVQIK